MINIDSLIQYKNLLLSSNPLKDFAFDDFEDLRDLLSYYCFLYLIGLLKY